MSKARFRRSWYVGFDCRRCSMQIPVYRNALNWPDARQTGSKLIVMCPQCGFSSPYAGQEAYRFSCEQGSLGYTANGISGAGF
jgi:RNase P subunit RPR2